MKTKPTFLKPPKFASLRLLAIAALALGLLALATRSFAQDKVAAWGGWPGLNWVPEGVRGVVAIAAGGTHHLVVKSDGTVVAWGANGWGQTIVPNVLSGVTAVAAGDSHNLALKSDGTVVAWGNNEHGQATVPGGLSGVIAIAAGFWHSLALKSDGTVVGWGTLLGTFSGGLSDVIAIAAGSFHSLALKSDGTVFSWGHYFGSQSAVPNGLSGVIAVAAGFYHDLALKSDGTVVAWGPNVYGETVVPAGLSGVIAIAANGYHSLTLGNNVPPMANAQTVRTFINTPVNVTLSGLDLNGDVLSFAIVSGPSHGTLSGIPPALAYTPAAGYAGPDSFTFKTNDGESDSEPAVVAVEAEAVTFWRGPKITFAVPDFADLNNPANQDQITPGVRLAHDSYLLYNAALEPYSDWDRSPADTEWAFGTTANLADVSFQPFLWWSEGDPFSVVGRNAVLHLISERILIDIKITSWSWNGGFAYERSTPCQPPMVVSCPTDAAIEGPATPAFGTPRFSDPCDNNLSVTSADTSLPISGQEVSKTRRTWTAANAAGNSVSCSQIIKVVNTTPPTISCPADVTINTTSVSGRNVNYPAATASDTCSTVAITYSKASGSFFDLGVTTVTVTATDAKGNSAQGTFKVNVIYSWTGVLQPINADGSSVFKGNSTVPVKFQLSGASAGITDLVAKLSYVKVSSAVAETVNEAASNSVATSGNLFRYDATAGQYIFNWSTRALSAGTYQLQIDLGDGVARTVNVALK